MKLEIDYVDVDLSEVMRYWAKDFKTPGGGKVELGEFWVDTAKNRVIFKLYREVSDG